MRTPRLFVLAFALFAAPVSAADWPELTRENKPWTRWWWPGSAVDKPSLTRQLEQLAAVGIGGVEITPIYGARGYEERYIEFLSPRWLEMLAHVGTEARRLGLGVDMATGTGWPFGGPWIDEPHALQRAVLKDGQLAGEPTRMMVKRAAPGSEGLVADPYSTSALERHLAPFSTAFADFPRELIRGQFHDSFEYFNASWTPRLPEAFRRLHGYDVQPFAAALLAKTPAEIPANIDLDTLQRVKSDYRATLAALHLEYLQTWIRWSHERGFLVRNQSHGAPANLLDLYGAVDIPETETFGSTPFPIPGLRRAAEDVRHDQDLPESLVIRMASSAAHVAGRKLVSSETATWLREHWKVSLAFVKPELDRLLTDGINHIFYHGTVFSPQDVPWPGWLFYASTQFNPNNTWWRDFGALNAYVARVQSVLQRTKSDNELLVYWPFHDVIDSADGLMKMLGVHDVKWLTEQPVGRVARQLLDRGTSFDYISDAQLAEVRVDPTGGHTVRTAGGTYPQWTSIVVPRTRRMPVETLRRLIDLAAENPRASVIFLDALPEDVPGFGRLAERRAAFHAELARLRFGEPGRHGVRIARVGEGAVALCATEQLAAAFTDRLREPIADHGIRFIRRRTEGGLVYFFANLSAQPFDGWTALRFPRHGVVYRNVEIMDPLTGVVGQAATRYDPADDEPQRVYLQLAPGEAQLLRLTEQTRSDRPPWPYRQVAGEPVALGGTWSIAFTEGGPELPPPLTTTNLGSWSELGGEPTQRFGGTARYRLEFDAPATPAADWLLNLGDVRESARVRLNGRELGTLWSLPFHMRVGHALQQGRNVLEVDVTNLAANRIRDLDRRGVPWKIMREINFVNINYRPFDASGWPLTPSGLLGPVTLTPLRELRP